MIEMPKRSVTRFFIPLIDVMILLFCIFLLMPFVSSSDENQPPQQPTADPKNELPKDVAQLQKQLLEAKKRLERSLKDKSVAADRLSVRVLEMDRTNGKLYAFEPDAKETRQEVASQADAQRLIDRQRRIAGTKEPFFLILYPRELTGYPLQKQVDQYRRWFKEVSHGFDNPWSGL
jgi:biopolymer transport protein ExbD